MYTVVYTPRTRPCTRGRIHGHGRVHHRVHNSFTAVTGRNMALYGREHVYRPYTRPSVYTTMYTALHSPYVHGHVHGLYTALYSCIRAVYTSRIHTRPCTRLCTGHVHGPYTHTAVYTVHTRPSTRPRLRHNGRVRTVYTAYTAVYTVRVHGAYTRPSTWSCTRRCTRAVSTGRVHGRVRAVYTCAVCTTVDTAVCMPCTGMYATVYTGRIHRRPCTRAVYIHSGVNGCVQAFTARTRPYNSRLHGPCMDRVHGRVRIRPVYMACTRRIHCHRHGPCRQPCTSCRRLCTWAVYTSVNAACTL